MKKLKVVPKSSTPTKEENPSLSIVSLDLSHIPSQNLPGSSQTPPVILLHAESKIRPEVTKATDSKEDYEDIIRIQEDILRATAIIGHAASKVQQGEMKEIQSQINSLESLIKVQKEELAFLERSCEAVSTTNRIARLEEARKNTYRTVLDKITPDVLEEKLEIFCKEIEMSRSKLVTKNFCPTTLPSLDMGGVQSTLRNMEELTKESRESEESYHRTLSHLDAEVHATKTSSQRSGVLLSMVEEQQLHITSLIESLDQAKSKQTMDEML